MQPLDANDDLALIRLALQEDLGSGDVTTLATIPAGTQAQARMVAREPLVVAGLDIAAVVFKEISSLVQARLLAHDGQSVIPGQPLLEISGPAAALLAGERVALNFIQRLSGVATLTARFVDKIQGTRTAILDTRKTTPGWRRLEKYAVTCGGGRNHRFGLWDRILIKDNHLAALADQTPNAIAAAVTLARQRFPQLKIEVEADTLAQVEQAVQAGADMILLDNMNPETLRKAVALVAGRCPTEASGGITLDTVRAVAETGVDFISVGALTHSARAMDIGLDFQSQRAGTPPASPT